MNKRYIRLDKIAEALAMKPELITLLFDQYKKADALKKDVDYIVADEKIHLTLSGLLWLVSKGNIDFRLAVPLAEKLATDSEAVRIMDAHKALLKQLPEIREALVLATETVDNALSETLPEMSEEAKKSQWYKTNSKQLPNLTTEEQEWSRKMNTLLGTKSKEYGKMGVHVQKRIYGLMTARYGVVWSQVKKDTKQRFNVDPEEPITTFRCVVYDPKLRSIYEGLLTDYKG